MPDEREANAQENKEIEEEGLVRNPFGPPQLERGVGGEGSRVDPYELEESETPANGGATRNESP